MEVKAFAKYIRMSPRKVRLVAGLVRGLKVLPALDQLKFNQKHASDPMLKLLNSAIANADHNFNIKKDNLYIKELLVNGGPTLKRWLPRAHGRATPLNKRTSHINLTLAEIVDSGLIAGKKPTTEAPIKLSDKAIKQEDAAEAKLKQGKKDKAEKETADEKTLGAEHKPESKVKLGSAGHQKIEGGSKGFTNKLFNRKSG